MKRVSVAWVVRLPTCISSLGQGIEGVSPSYVLSFPRHQTHFFEVTMTVANVTTPQLDLQMATWTPGSYLQREFERNVQDFKADSAGRPLTWEKTNKATWRITTGASAASPRTIRATYRVYANELATQTSHLDATH